MKHLQLTDKLIEEICSFVQEGSSFKNAYLLSGVNKHTGSHWRETALKDLKENKTAEESIYVRLSEAMDEAKATYIRSLVDCVIAAGKKPKHWRT